MRLCIGIVFYNPSFSEIQKVIEYQRFCDSIFLFDNSDNKKIEIDVTYIHYMNYGRNMGLAYALNEICQSAKDMYFTHILLLDQDSIINLESFKRLKDYASKHQEFAIIAPVIVDARKSSENTSNFNANAQKVPFSITSGSIFNLSIWNHIGKFDTALFIDGIDREYCIRCIKNNYSIIQINHAFLLQTIGDKSANIFGIYEHSPLRNYYIFRNRLYIIHKHKDYFTKWQWWKSAMFSPIAGLLSILLLEGNKRKKLIKIVEAYKDFENHRMGDYFKNKEQKHE